VLSKSLWATSQSFRGSCLQWEAKKRYSSVGAIYFCE